MRVRTKLRLSAATQIVLVALVGVILAISFRAIQQSNARASRVDTISHSITELRFVTFEDLLHHNQRTLEQWNLKHQQISTLLNREIAKISTQQEIIRNMLDIQSEIATIFNRLVESYEDPDIGGQQSISDFQERLVGQLLVKQQIQIADATRLSNLIRQSRSKLIAQSNLLILITILGVLVITLANSSIISRSISKSLGLLERGTKAVARGKLNYRIKPGRTHDEFRDLAVAFNSMAENLQQVDRLKTEFVMLASHQLLTPATAVKGLVSMLLDGYSGQLSPSQRAQLSAANAENETQLKIINQIVEVAKIEVGESMLSKSPTDLAQLVKRIVAEYATALKAKDQSIKIVASARPLKIPIDPDKLALAIGVLIDNASKYSPANSDILLEIIKIPTGASIQVIDKGYGIAEADIGQLFKKFSRLSNPNSIQAGGSGLGLYLAKTIVDLHKGRLSVSSKLGHGSTFTIKLPLQ